MIAMLTGQLVSKGTDQIIIEVAGGVGYRVLIPLSTFYALPDEGTVKLHIHTHVREDALLLYGFLTADERALFILLLSVAGVGPKLALNILSHASPGDLRQAISRGDVKKLATLPGIGNKSAERLVLELKEKVNKLDLSDDLLERGRDTAMTPSSPDQTEDALSALLNLGYKDAQARKALASIVITPETPLEEILKNALKSLMR
ncbi:MAG: Holliday junction branch migration protein RuvA [Desulfuromonadales bacterium]|nr:Holliday junction branch migration protein RuvA [Desulfuromonadales bacterium]